jgi:hypothetical protein
MINVNFCRSVKSKNNNGIPCTNKPKEYEIFCGIHLKSKNIVLYKENNNDNGHDNGHDNGQGYSHDNDQGYSHDNGQNNNQLVTNMGSSNSINNQNNQININNQDIKIDTHEIKIVSNDNKTIYSKEDLYDIVNNKSDISVFSLRKSIVNCKLNKFVNTKQSKSLLLKSLAKFIERERYFLSNEYSIILVQSIYRKWSVNRRKICHNESDIGSFIDKYEIPTKYFYIFNDNITNKKYAYDIRTLLEIIRSNYPSCPYTFRKFTDEEKEKLYKYEKMLNNANIDTSIEKLKLTPTEEINMRAKDIFYKINMLDNYTSHLWFMNLNLHQLIVLYIKCEDIWMYRTMMPLSDKKRIVHSGIAFNIPIQMIKSIKSILQLQNIILIEFNRFVSEGIDREEKKLGALLILSGLVEVSGDAAMALPHLVQI